MTTVHGSRELGARLHRWHAGMDSIYAVGSQFYAGRPAPLRDVKEALRLLEQEHRNRKATKLRRDAVTHLNAVIADLHDAMWSAIGEHGDPDAGTDYPRENPGRYVMDMTRIPIGSMVLFGGQRWLVDDVHGYPTKTVDLRRTIIVDPKRRYLDGAEFRRGVPVKHLDDYEAYIEAAGEPRENPAPIVRQRITELLPDVVIHYTAHGVWLRGMPRSYRGDRMWSASGVDEAREMAAYLARGLRATGAVRGVEIAQGSPEKARRSR